MKSPTIILFLLVSFAYLCQLGYSATETSSFSDYPPEAQSALQEAELTDIVEVQDCIPEVAPVLQDDGTYIYEIVKSCPEESSPIPRFPPEPSNQAGVPEQKRVAKLIYRVTLLV